MFGFVDSICLACDNQHMKLIILLILVLAGCAYPTKKESYKFQTSQRGKVAVNIYRTQTAIDSVNPDVPRFYINDTSLGRLTIGGYYRTEVNPGEVSVTYKSSLFGIPFFWNDGEVKFIAVENQAYFLKFSIETFMRLQEFKIVPTANGENEIKGTNLLVN